jgi:exodeoxyribonuclease VII large subunit
MIQEKNILSVTELTRHIKTSLETAFVRIWVQGELSNFKQHTSGHLYFSLKDEGAQLSGVMWRSRVPSLGFVPEDGMKVVVRGSLTVYPPRGSYQIDAEQMQPLGVGEQQLAFERLKKKLADEGLFDADRKKPIPPYPERIGIVTSETGAAFHDVVSVIRRRNPGVELLLFPVRVQGEGAAEEIASAISDANRCGDVDVLLVGRGGGSAEDLWAFNDERVARAIAASKIPIISAVGHEVDFSIADFAADLRAPTPSAAAELVVRDRTEILEEIANLCYTMRSAVTAQWEAASSKLSRMVSSYSFNRPRDAVREYSQHIDELERRAGLAVLHRTTLLRQRHTAVIQHLEALNPAGVLQRGYTIIRKDGKILKSAKQLHRDDPADIQFHDGIVVTRVERGRQ